MAKLKYHNGQEWEQLAPNMEEYNTTKGMIGTLANLLTTAKNNLVVAINEIVGWVDDVEDALASHKAEKASKTAFGHVKVGSKLSVSNGVISADNQIIPPTFGQATYDITLSVDNTETKTINIGANKTRGIMIIHGDEGNALVFFTTIAEEAKGVAAIGPTYYYSRRAQDVLTGNIGYRIKLQDAYINGTELRLVFINNVAGSGNFSGTIYWEAW